MTKIFDELNKINNIPNKIICMDSNNSKEYEESIKLGEFTIKNKTTKKNIKKHLKQYLSEIIEGNKYTNLSDRVEGFECYKMRHAMGGQPKKFCEFMFDTIDKILVNNKSSKIMNRDEMKNITGFNYYPDKKDLKTILSLIRNNEKYRKIFKNICSLTTSESSINAFNDISIEELKNGKLPIKKMNNKTKTQIKNNLSKINVNNFKKQIPDFKFLQYIYPNMKAPSDHPPMGAEITLI